MKQGLFVLLAMLLLSACSLLLPVDVGAQKTYVLNSEPLLSKPAKLYSQVLLVTQPRLDPLMNNNQMVYLDGQHQLGYFTENRWAAKPNQLFFSVLVETLQKSTGFRAVVGAPYSGLSDQRLDILNFSIVQDFTRNPSVLTVKMDLQFSDVKQQRLLAAKSIQASVATSANTPQAGVDAANLASVDCLKQIVAFVEAQQKFS